MMQKEPTIQILDVVLITPILSGGLGSVTLTLAKTLCKRGLSVEIWVLNNLATQLCTKGVAVRDISSLRAGLSLIKITKLLRRFRPKRIISASYHMNCITIIATIIGRIDSHLVICEHTSLTNALQTLTWHKRLFSKISIVILYRLSNVLIAVSNEVARQVERHAILPKNSVLTIYNPIIDEEFFQKSREKFAHPFFQIDEPLFLSVGRISEEKDYPTLLAAFALVNKTMSARLIIAGDGPETESIKKLIGKLGLSERVSLLGYIPNTFPLYKAADVFLLASKREGLPTVLVEALALGCKIISTDAECGPREILNNGAYGKLVPVGDIDSFAKAMIEIMKSDNNLNLPNGALRNYQVNFSVDNYLNALNM